jgi:hypothetical protein
MQYAKLGNERVLPAKGMRAVCPQCNGEVLSKCGSIKIHHWAHIIKDCDLWAEPITDWHIGWQSLVPEENREVTVGCHRADIKLNSGLVVEIQHSSISSEAIAERESFYKNMFWIFDARDYADRFIHVSDNECQEAIAKLLEIPIHEFSSNEPLDINREIEVGSREIHFQIKRITIKRFVVQESVAISFKWLREKPSILTCKKPVFFDVGGCNLLYINNEERTKNKTGGGYIIPKKWITDVFSDENNEIKHIKHVNQIAAIPIGSTVYGKLGLGCILLDYQPIKNSVTIKSPDDREQSIPLNRILKWKYQVGVAKKREACKICGCENFNAEKTETHHPGKLTCQKCGNFFRWLSKKDALHFLSHGYS